jgi:hypothetical protein
MEMKHNKAPMYGLLAEFDDATAVTEAARRVYEAGYRKIDAYSPFPIEELSHAIGFHKNSIAKIVLIGGILGGIGGFSLESFASAVWYPLNVGGRPLISWPSFIPVTFETTVLCAALSAVFGMIIMNGFPQPYHPVFNAPNFQFASHDRFFISIEADDKLFDWAKTKEFLASLGATEVVEVES